MKLKKIDISQIKFDSFPESTRFNYGDNDYQVQFSAPDEIRMSVFVRELKVLKNGNPIKSETVSDCSYLELNSPNRRFLALPTRNGLEIIDLENGKSTEIDSYFMIGNQFDSDSKFCLVNGQNDTQLIDLESLRVIYRNKNPENYISQARFGFDNNVWTIENWGQKMRVEHLNPNTLKVHYSIISTPFEFYQIDGEKYEKLIRNGKHCIWLRQGGGMRFPSFLNKWEFVNTSEKIIYKSTVPKTEIKFSENYNVDSFEADFEYIEIVTDETPETKINSEKDGFWEKIKRLTK